MEAGWITTEVGRQPWIVYGLVRTRDAVTNADGIIWSLIGTTLVYFGLTAATVIALRRVAGGLRSGGYIPTPYGPPPPGA